MSKHKSIQKSQATKIPKLDIPNGFSDKEMRYMKEIKPKSINQKKYLDLIKEKKIIITTGPAGSGKSCLCVQFAVQELIKKNYERIIITRPYIGAEAGMGHLPGTLEEKMDPFIRPIFDEMINYGLTCEEIKKKVADKVIEIVPILYARGRNFHNSIIIIDEAQNCTYDQLLLLITRIGRKSRIIINGDPSQSDLPESSKINLDKFGQFLSSIKDVGYIRLTNEDIVREVIVGEILERLERWEL